MKYLSLSKFIFMLIMLCFTDIATAHILLPDLICDNMVLQQKTNVQLWGKSSGKIVKAYASWSTNTYATNVLSDGSWEIELQTPEAGGPYKIVLDDGEKKYIRNILIGDVWLCSGQSNMEMPIKGFEGQPVGHSIRTISEASERIPIRLFTVRKNSSKIKQYNCNGKWNTNNSEAVANFSATAYFFGNKLYQSLSIPIGLINASWGGSAIESWMDPDVLRLFPEISQAHLSNMDVVENPHQAASMLYHAMMFPLRKYTIKGMIWYQGERNRFNPAQYEKLLPAFVCNMRTLFGLDKLPFYYAQIAPFGYNDKNHPLSGALLREAQWKCETLIPASGMAVLTDIGDLSCIHPSRKQEVGARLAYLALHDIYDKKGIEARPPRYVSIQIKDGRAILFFERIGMGLSSFGKPLNCFEIAGADGIFRPAKAIIRGKEREEVWNKSIQAPCYVRYAFCNYTEGGLYGCNGLPVSSFRTDTR